MIPLIGTEAEFDRLKILVDETAQVVSRETGRPIPYKIGTMIEIPRAALQAAEIAENGRLLLLRHQRPDADDLRLLARRRRVLPADVHREGDPAGGPVREPRPGRRGGARRDRDRARPADEPEAEGRRLRRARRRPALDRVLPPRRPRLRLLLALTACPSRASRRRGRRCPGRKGVSRRPRDRTAGAAADRLPCRSVPPAAPADLVLLSAKIWTGDPARPQAQALAAAAGGSSRSDRTPRSRALAGPDDRRPRRRGPARRARLHRRAHAHDDGRAEPARARPAPDEGRGRLHAAARGLREDPARRASG